MKSFTEAVNYTSYAAGSTGILSHRGTFSGDGKTDSSLRLLFPMKCFQPTCPYVEEMPADKLYLRLGCIWETTPQV